MSHLETLHIRAGAFEGFRALLWEHGIEPAAIFSEINLDESSLNFPDFLVPTQKYREALNLAAKLTNQPHFGLLMSQKQTLHKFGAIGYLMMHASTVGQSISCLDQYLRLHDVGTVASIEIRNKVVLWTVGLRALSGVSALQHTELALGIAVKVVRLISSETWCPDAVYFEHAKPKNTSVHEQVFRCPIYFEQAANGLEYPEAFLKTKLRFKVYTPDNSMLSKIIKNDFETVPEAFIDRAYNTDLSLVSRAQRNALIQDKYQAWAQLILMVNDAKVKTISQESIAIRANTYCIHGDAEGAVEILAYIHSKLKEEKIAVK